MDQAFNQIEMESQSMALEEQMYDLLAKLIAKRRALQAKDWDTNEIYGQIGQLIKAIGGVRHA